MEIHPVFAWFDIWIGAYYDTKNKRLYFMIPFIGIYIELRRSKDANLRR